MLGKHLHGKKLKRKEAVLVVNTHSRVGQRFFFEAMDALADQGISVEASYPVRKPARLPEVIQEAINRRHQLIIVGGGDGTISSVVDFFAYRDVVLGILPLGTSNSFARTLGLPLNLTDAVRIIAEGHVTKIDLGRADNDYFANYASLGFSGEIARRTSVRLKHLMGFMAYIITGSTVFLTHRAFRCDLIVENVTYSTRTHQIIVAKGNYMGVIPLSPESHTTDHNLTIFTMNRRQTLRLYVSYLLRREAALTRSHHITAPRVRIVTTPQQYVDIDGEITTRSPVTISVAPHALQVVTPRTI